MFLRPHFLQYLLQYIWVARRAPCLQPDSTTRIVVGAESGSCLLAYVPTCLLAWRYASTRTHGKDYSDHLSRYRRYLLCDCAAISAVVAVAACKLRIFTAGMATSISTGTGRGDSSQQGNGSHQQEAPFAHCLMSTVAAKNDSVPLYLCDASVSNRLYASAQGVQAKSCAAIRPLSLRSGAHSAAIHHVGGLRSSCTTTLIITDVVLWGGGE